MHREAALQLRDQVANLRYMKSARSNKQHVIRFDRAILGIDGAALHNGQNVPLYAFPAYIGAVAPVAPGNFVDLVNEHNAILFRAANGFLLNGVGIHQLVGFLLLQDLARFLHLYMADLGLFGHHAAL